MQDLTPKQKKAIAKIRRVAEKGNVGILEHLLEIEEQIPAITEVISKVKGEKGDNYVLTDKDKKEIAKAARELLDEDRIADNVKSRIEIPIDQIAKKVLKQVVIPKPIPGKTPTRKELLDIIEPLIPEPIPGEPGTSANIEEIEKSLVDNMPQFGAQFRDGLTLLPEGDRLPIGAVENLSQELLRIEQRAIIAGHGGGPTRKILAGENITVREVGGDTVISSDLATYVSGLPISTFTNDVGYLASGDDVSNLVNDAGYITAVTGSPLTADRYWYGNGLDAATEGTITAFGRSMLDDANAAAHLATLGITSSIAELNFTDGVTSNIQTQIDAKFTLPSFTAGSVLFSNGTTIAQNNSYLNWDDTNKVLRVGITGGSSTIRIVSNAGIGAQIFDMTNNVDTNFQVRVTTSGAGDKYALLTSTTATDIAIGANTTERMRFKSATEAVFNDAGNDYDLRIESDGDANNFFSDGGTNRIGIGTGTPAAKLHVLNTVAADIGLKIVDPASSSNYCLSVENPAGTLAFLRHQTFGGIASVLGVQSSATKYFQMESYAGDNNYFSAAGATFAIRTIGAFNMAFFTDTSTQRMLISGASGHLVVGSTSTNGDARIHSIVSAGSNHLRLGIDISNTVYANWSLGSTGNLTMDIAGASASDPRWIFSDDVQVPDEAYGAGWNGSAEVPTKNAIYDKLETIASDVLFDHFADANNSGTSETDLYSDTLAAAQLSADGQKIVVQYGGIFTGDATSTQRLKVYFGGTSVFDSGALGVGVGTASWDLYVTLIRVSASVVRVSAALNTSFASLSAYAQYTEVTGLTLANTQVVKVTGTAAGATGASNQITAKEGYVKFEPAA